MCIIIISDSFRVVADPDSPSFFSPALLLSASLLSHRSLSPLAIDGCLFNGPAHEDETELSDCGHLPHWITDHSAVKPRCLICDHGQLISSEDDSVIMNYGHDELLAAVISALCGL